jgi:hypothetical protein
VRASPAGLPSGLALDRARFAAALARPAASASSWRCALSGSLLRPPRAIYGGIQRRASRFAYVRGVSSVRDVGHTGRPRRVGGGVVGAHDRDQSDHGGQPMIAGFTIHNFFLVGTLAVLFIVAFKYAAGRLNIGGLKAIAQNL